MKNLFIKISILLFVCVIGLIFIHKIIELYPLLFGLILGLFNWKKLKKNKLKSFILSIIACYLAFSLAVLSLNLFTPIKSFISDNSYFVLSNDDVSRLGFVIAPSIIASLLTFISYKFIFEIPKTKFSTVTIIITIILLLIQSSLYYYKYGNSISYNILNPYVIWQVIMIISLQILIFQKNEKS